jgi:hypothetical protein
MFKDSIILDAIRWSFFTKSAATAAIFTSVRVEFGRPLLSSSSTSNHLEIVNTAQQRLIGSEPNYHKPFEPIIVFLSL